MDEKYSLKIEFNKIKSLYISNDEKYINKKIQEGCIPIIIPSSDICKELNANYYLVFD